MRRILHRPDRVVTYHANGDPVAFLHLHQSELIPDLQALAAKNGVRLVDVGPNADPDPKANYRGLRPEETAKANDPNTRPT